MKKWLANNTDWRFPEDGEPYCAGWSPPEKVDKDKLDEALTWLKHSMIEAPPEQIRPELMSLVAHFPNKNSDEQWRVIIRDYTQELSRFPIGLIREAVREHKRRGRYFPKLSELVKLIEPGVAEYKRMISRAEILLNREPEPKVAEHVKDPRVERGLTDLVAQLRAKSAGGAK